MPYYKNGPKRGQKATIIWDNNIKAYKLHMDYFEGFKDFIEMLKSNIPSSERSYNPKDQTWIISDHWFDIVRDLVKLKHDKVEVLTKDEVEAKWKEYNRPVSTPLDTNKELKTFVELIVKATGVEVSQLEDIKRGDANLAQKYYKRALLYFHPDRNPDRAADCTSLNAAFMNLKPFFGLDRQQETI